MKSISCIVMNLCCGGTVSAVVLSFTYSSLNVSSMFMKEIVMLKDIYAITKNIYSAHVIELSIIRRYCHELSVSYT